MLKAIKLKKVLAATFTGVAFTLALGTIAPLAAAPVQKDTPSKDKVITTKSGLKYIEATEGKGKEAKLGSTVKVHYTGTFEDGKKFDSSLDRNEPFTVTIGKTPVIKGWTEGLQGMKVGGKRKLIIPADLAYGPKGKPPVIPENATLLFEIELLDVE